MSQSFTREQLKTLYTSSSEAVCKYGFMRSCADKNWDRDYQPQWLYGLALEIAGVESMADADILPTVFGSAIGCTR